MLQRTLQFIGSEWKLCAFFSLIIITLSAVPIIWKIEGLINILLFLYGLGVFGSFSAASSKIMQGEKFDNKYGYILFNKDKIGYDFIILLVFFSAILLLVKGPLVLVQYTMGEKINTFISSLGNAAIAISVPFLLLYSIYKIALYSALANLFYYRKEVLESFKSGLKGIVTFKLLLILVIALDLFYSFLGTMPMPPFNLVANLTFYLIPAFIILLMLSHFQQADEKLKAEENNGKFRPTNKD